MITRFTKYSSYDYWFESDQYFEEFFFRSTFQKWLDFSHIISYFLSNVRNVIISLDLYA